MLVDCILARMRGGGGGGGMGEVAQAPRAPPASQMDGSGVSMMKYFLRKLMWLDYLVLSGYYNRSANHEMGQRYQRLERDIS